MRIASINTNKGLNGDRRRDLEGWLARIRPHLLLVQEPVPAPSAIPSVLAGFSLISGNHLVAVYATNSLDVDVDQLDDRWLRACTSDWTVDNVYLPHESRTGRQHFLDRLSQRSTPRRLIVGDFNMAPRPQDGRYGHAESAWTGVRERRAWGPVAA
jgi:exonuclease III